jgi:hypothetical protein
MTFSVSNLTCDGRDALGFAFAAPAWSSPVAPLAGPGLVVQSLPCAATLAFLLLLEAAARGPVAWGFRLLAATVSLLAGATGAFLAWRVFSLLGCEGRAGEADWRVPAVLAAAAAAAALVFLAVRCAPRLASLLALATAAAAVVADWALRGGVTAWEPPSRAADLLVAVQVLWCVQAVALAMLVRRRRKRTAGRAPARLVYRLPRWRPAAAAAAAAPAVASSSATSVDLVVDSLARRPGSRGEAASAVAGAREEERRREVGRSWFW